MEKGIWLWVPESILPMMGSGMEKEEWCGACVY